MKLSFVNWIRIVVIAGVGDIYVFYVEKVSMKNVNLYLGYVWSVLWFYNFMIAVFL